MPTVEPLPFQMYPEGDCHGFEQDNATLLVIRRAAWQPQKDDKR